MANLKSSKKDAIRSKVRAARNNGYRSALKTAIKKFTAAVEAKNTADVNVLFRTVQSRIGKALKTGNLKKNTAARRLSRFSRMLTTVGSAAA
jgi:small subunit ribosomal protein S20